MKSNVNILIVDDTYEKVQVIASVLDGIDGYNISYSMSVRDALKKIKKIHYDILVVDIQIPIGLGEQISKTGGIELLDHCCLDDELYRPTHIVGITSHEETYKEHYEYFINKGWVFINGSNDSYLIKSVLISKIKHSYPKPKSFDVAVVTALFKTELEAVLKLECGWKEVRYPNDNNLYYVGEFKDSNNEVKSIVATSCSRMGMSAAAATTMKVCNLFKPKFIFMTGIAAGIQGKSNIGDVLVADPCWDWGCGKKTIKDGQVALLNAPHQIQLKPQLRFEIQNISNNRLHLDEIYCNWKDSNRPQHSLQVHIGPIATGAVVLEDPSTVKSIIDQHRETIGIEMEAYGFAYAASIANQSPPTTIIMKSVCDFANIEKNDDWQAYAAYTSTQLAFKIMVNHLEYNNLNQ